MREEKKIDDIEKFIQETKKDYDEWKLGDSPWYPWFRGEPMELKHSKPLLPRLYRGNPPGDYYENRLLQHFRMRAEVYGDTPHRDQTDQWLFLAQHVGLPTRLLDWTESSLAGLYFALGKQKGVVWMLNPFALNNLALGKDPTGLEYNVYGLTWHTREGEKNIASANINAAWQGDRGGIDLPVAIAPTYIHTRIPAQKSCFTVHGNRKESLYEILKDTDILRKYVIDIDESERKKMLGELRILGVSHATLFPDLDGLAKDLTQLFRPDLP